MSSHLFSVSFVSLVWGDRAEKILLGEKSKILLPMCSFRIFMVLSLTFKSLIHFEFLLVYGVRRWSSFTFLRVSVQFSQHHLLNRLHCMFLPPLSNISQPYRHGFISGLCSVHWSMCLFYASTMLFWLLWACSVVRYQVAWHFQLCSFFSILLRLFGLVCVFFCFFWFFLWFHLSVWIICSSSVKYTIVILIGIALNL